MKKTNYHKQFRRGCYPLKNPSKFLGKGNPFFRSSYEEKFFKICDESPKIIAWGSESFAIPYINPFDKKQHLYYIDNFVVMDDKKKYLVEIKPLKQTVAPKISKNKKEKTLIFEQYTFGVNQAKWKYAEQFANANNCEFVILTEKELGIEISKR
jgi:hypothetical protein